MIKLSNKTNTKNKFYITHDEETDTFDLYIVDYDHKSYNSSYVYNMDKDPKLHILIDYSSLKGVDELIQSLHLIVGFEYPIEILANYDFNKISDYLADELRVILGEYDIMNVHDIEKFNELGLTKKELNLKYYRVIQSRHARAGLLKARKEYIWQILFDGYDKLKQCSFLSEEDVDYITIRLDKMGYKLNGAPSIESLIKPPKDEYESMIQVINSRKAFYKSMESIIESSSSTIEEKEAFKNELNNLSKSDNILKKSVRSLKRKNN